MTTAKPLKLRDRVSLPDIPPRNPDEATRYDHLHRLGNAHHLLRHFAARGDDPATTLVTADRWIVADLASFRSLARYPDLLIAFGVDPDAYRASNGYVIAEQGRPPDFVLEVASASTGRIDVGEKRDDYAALGIREYWRFDETGRFHGARLAGDRLLDGAYVPIPIAELSDGILQGYSEALDLHLRWRLGQLRWHDPAGGRHIVTFDDERARADDAEARVRELEAELRRLRDD